jgi:alkylation response protein AidB-like acyl-CoA dehydrogenase
MSLHEDLRDSARAALSDAGRATDREKIRQLIVDMGWLGMAVPEEQGGVGLGRDALGVLYVETGRALCPGPLIAQLLAIEALAGAGPPGAALLERAIAGEIFTASLAAPGLDGLAMPDADKASLALVVTTEQCALMPLAGATLRSRTTWDETRRLFDVTFSGPPALIIAEGTRAKALAPALQAHLLFALAGDSLGAAGAVLEMTIEYLKTRRQFDRPLAMFQALKHRCADLKTALAAADALFYAEAAHGEADLARVGALKAHVTAVAAEIAEEAIQLHGGIGLTQEYPCHLFLKRILLNSAFGGGADHWLEQAGRRKLRETLAAPG